MPKSRAKSAPEIQQTFDSLSRVLPPHALQHFKSLTEQDGAATWQLRFSPGTDLFSDEELKFIDQLKGAGEDQPKSLHDHIVVILKATRLCNLRCTYCHSWRVGPGNIMPFEMLARITRDAVSMAGVRAIDFVWHGGEVTLLPVRDVKRAIWLQQKFGSPEIEIVNSIQTNATRLTVEWLNLFEDHKFSVGVSIDGPPEVHDKRRVNTKGRGTSKDVENGIRMLRESGIKFGALAVIDECTLSLGPKLYLDYLVQVGAPAVALLNALPGNGSSVASEKWFAWERYCNFLRELFQVWWGQYRHQIVVRELHSLVEAITTGYTGLCIYRENCMGRYLTVEPNGDVAACDKYVGDRDFVFGNILDTSLGRMLRDSSNLEKAKNTVEIAKSQASKCPNYAICNGGCPHDVRLRQLHANANDIFCCGMSDLIGDIRNAVSAP